MHIYEAELRARRSGPLFLYVNDAAPVLDLDRYYVNNEGTAQVQVRLLDLTNPARPNDTRTP
jgi:hypothetical protein